MSLSGFSQSAFIVGAPSVPRLHSGGIISANLALAARMPQRPTKASPPTIYVYGDSLADAASADWFTYASGWDWAKSTCVNRAVGGTSSAQAATRQASDAFPTSSSTCTYIWTGHNDEGPGWTTVFTLANLATMVSAATLNGGDYRILEVLPFPTPEFYTGTADRLVLDALNAALLSLYGSRSIHGILAALQAHGNGSSQDNTDIANGIVPSSLRQSTTIHPNLISTNGLGQSGDGVVYRQVMANN